MVNAIEEILLAGLDRPVELLVDQWGIAHIYAETQADCFFAQGWNAARDRLWQIDLWRKRGLGLLAGDFGPDYVARDRSARLLLYRGDMASEWACYGANAKAWTEAFVAGINARIGELEARPELLPEEFRLLDTRPARWRAEDVVRVRSHARIGNLDSKIRRAAVTARYGQAADAGRKRLRPEWRPADPEGVAQGEIPPEVMATYQLGTEPLVFGALPALGEDGSEGGPDGSNAWALRPELSETGRALLASDPHRVHGMPSLRYMVHLQAPGLNVIGAGEPAVPGVSLGHNERLGFGLTIWPVDQEDLCVLELHPDDAGRYREGEGEGWGKIEEVRETVPVRGQAAREVTLAFTRHGPVLHHNGAAGRAYALRTVWSEPGTAAYLASLNYMQAENWIDYRRALEGWGAPPTNHVVADVEGNIGWATAGMVPRRGKGDGLLPVPGDGSHEWDGFLAAAEKPNLFNPASGWVATANQFNLPEDFDWRRHRTNFEWPDPARHQVITRALKAKRRHSFADMRALQTSFQALPAERVVALLAAAGVSGAAADLLRAWDCRLSADSGPAALFEIWWGRHLVPGILAAASSPEVQALALAPDTELALDLLEADRPGRDALLAETLERAWRDTVALLGAAPERWAWGRLHHGYFAHPLSALLDEDGRRYFDVGPAPKGGSGLTVNNNGYRAEDFRVMHGVTWRMLLDVGNWDACLTINAPGQSGDPADRHYRDLFSLWAREEYVPMTYTRPAVEAAAERRLLLTPTA